MDFEKVYLVIKRMGKMEFNVSNEAKYQIFISSTYTDLIEERQQVIREVIRAEQFPIAMENFVASNKNQWTTIERYLKNSGCLILLLGNRYGTIDKNDPNKISFTEKEFNLAEKLEIPILVFIRSGIESQKHSEKDKKYKKFKRKLEKNRLVCYFRNCAELSGAVAHSIALEKSFFKNPWYINSSVKSINDDVVKNAKEDIKKVNDNVKKDLLSLADNNYWNEDAEKMFKKYQKDLKKLPDKWNTVKKWEGGRDFKFLFEVRSDINMINEELRQKGYTKSIRYVYTDKTGMWVYGWYLKGEQRDS